MKFYKTIEFMVDESDLLEAGLTLDDIDELCDLRDVFGLENMVYGKGGAVRVDVLHDGDWFELFDQEA